MLFSHEHGHAVQHKNLYLSSHSNFVTIQQLELSCTFVVVVLDADASFPFLDFARFRPKTDIYRLWPVED